MKAGQPVEMVGLIGHPVGHSLSPLIHGAAFAAAGLEWRYVLRDVGPSDLKTALAALRNEGWRGFNVTLPLKRAILPLLDDLTDTARLVGAVNTVINADGRLIGDNTDAEGFGRALRATGWLPEDHRDRPALVLGAGGAARAAVCWLTGNSLPVFVVGRHAERSAELALALDRGRGLVTALPDTSVPDEVTARCGLVVQATSSGRDAPQWLPLRFPDLPSGTLCFDLNYDRLHLTPFCAAATAAGRPATDGLRMLVEQAAAAYSRWTGRSAPLAAMLAAVARPGEER